MRRRRAAGSSSLGTLRATSRDITLKSKVSRWVPPSDARRASGRCPACEWMNAARRMSSSLIDQPVDERPERFGLALLRALPDVAQHARRHRPVAVDDLAVELQLLGDVREHALGRRIAGRRKARRRLGPQLGEPSAGAARLQHADLALEPQHVLAQPLAVDAVRRDFLQHLVDHRGERTQRARSGTAVDEHQREVVAQARQVAIARKNRGPQAEAVDRVDTFAMPRPRRDEQSVARDAG